MNNNELKNKMDELKSREIILKKELANIRKSRNELSSFMNRCAIFDESVIYYITALLSYKEDKAFVPFVYKKIEDHYVSYNKDVESLHVGIAEGMYLTRFQERYDFGTLFQQKFGFDIFQTDVRVVEHTKDNREAYVGIHYGNREEPEKNKKITFAFLLDDYGIKNTYPVAVSHYNFEDYNYVQEFIRNLFDLQVKNNGKQLSYDEMRVALNNFVGLELIESEQEIKKILDRKIR